PAPRFRVGTAKAVIPPTPLSDLQIRNRLDKDPRLTLDPDPLALWHLAEKAVIAAIDFDDTMVRSKFRKWRIRRETLRLTAIDIARENRIEWPTHMTDTILDHYASLARFSWEGFLQAMGLENLVTTTTAENAAVDRYERWRKGNEEK